MIACEDVSCKSTVRNKTADGSHLLKILLTSILAVHQLQHTVTATLRREVDMVAEVRLGCNRLDNILRHIFRVGSREAYTHIRHALCHHVQEFCKRDTILRTLAIRQQTV